MNALALDEIARRVAATGGDLAAAIPLPGCDMVFFDLLAKGPVTSEAAREYEFVIEAVLEGHLMHTGRTRLQIPDNRELKLITGDFLYSLGLRELAQLGDIEAVELLANLITDTSRLHAEGGTARQKGTLWAATVVAVGYLRDGEYHNWPFKEVASGSGAAAEELIYRASKCPGIAGYEQFFQMALDRTCSVLAS